MSQIFIREIEKLKTQLICMFRLVEESFTRACRAVIEGDQAAAEQVFRKEREIDNKKVILQEECFKVIALHQPVAFDLRLIMATIKFNSNLERIGDLTEGMASRAQDLARLPPVAPPFDAEAMAKHVRAMMIRSLDALIKLDQALAVEVLADEDAVDAAHHNNIALIKEQIRRQPEHLDALINYILVSRYLERIADHVTNLAEEVIYITEGEII